MVIHLTLIPFLSAASELKTKPTQHSVKTLMESGVKANVLVCRTEHPITDEIRGKLALFCNVKQEAVIESIDAETIYDVPLLMQKEGLDKVVLKTLKLPAPAPADMKKWEAFLTKYKNPKQTINVGLIGKYVELQDSYKSILEAITHAGAINETKVNVHSIHSEYLDEKDVAEKINDLDGIIVAPGFGERGIQGKIEAIRYVRENNIPFLGICLGMQMAVIEHARNVAGLSSANSTEMEEDCIDPVISIMEEQKHIIDKGGTMRLGAWKCELKKDSLAYAIYQKETIEERHRHRYEFNDAYREIIEKNGLKATGINPETGLVEVVENPAHPWFIAVQYHPEYKSTVLEPHPLFVHFVQAALKCFNAK
jgi:CTP synthase